MILKLKLKGHIIVGQLPAVLMNATKKERIVPVPFEPAKIGTLEVRNRFIRSATYLGLADEAGFVGEPSVKLLKTLAENEVGLIVTGNTGVLRSGEGLPNKNSIETDDHIPGYKKMNRAVHDAGGRIAMQIGHNGVQARLAAVTGADYMAVSLGGNIPDFGRKPREMNEDDIANTIDAFGQAARRVREAGFDGVQIHGCHGYLVSQFLSPWNNKRTDRWGGSLENRMRFVIEVYRAIRKEVGEDFPVMIKLGCRDYLEGDDGLKIQEGARVAGELYDMGVCLVEISHGSVDPSYMKNFVGIGSPEKEAPMLPEARVFRETTPAPLSLVLGMRSLPVMEEIIRSGVVDFISLCRPLIREPGLIKRWKNGDTRPADCISCTGGEGHASGYGCFNADESGKIHVYCRQLKKNKSST